MKRYFFLFSLISILGCNINKTKTSTPPNLVLIYTDDLGRGDIGAYGGSVPTPHIDRLASQGILHQNAFSTASTCTPSRYSLLTGEYAWRENGRGVVDGDASALIKKGRQTLASLFKKAGYQTAAVGKWHLGLGENGINWNQTIENSPSDIGFDYHFIMPSTSDRVPCVYVEDGKVLNLTPSDPLQVSYKTNFDGLPTGKSAPERLKLALTHGHDMSINNGISRIGFQKGGSSAQWQDEQIADDFVRKSKEFIVKNKKNPFFLYLATNNIHVPRMPHPRFQQKSGQGLRGDAILELDAMVGALTRTLDSLKLLENTLIIFSSDNGAVIDDGYADFLPSKLNDKSPHLGERGGKYSLYQAGTHIPFIVSWKGKTPRAESHALVSQIDFIGSMASLLQLDFDRNQAPDTQNQLGAWLGKGEGREFIIQEGLQKQIALLKEGYKYIPAFQNGRKTAWQTGIETGFDEKPQLFFLPKDPLEQKNIATTHPQQVKALEQFLFQVKEKKKINKYLKKKAVSLSS